MSTRRNLIANVGGRVWTALMNFAFVPFYIRFMGIEAYGLVGFFASLLATFFVLDMGFSTTLNREMARFDAMPDGVAPARTLLRTMETIYWSIGLVICVAVIVAAPFIARRWLQLGTLPLDQATLAVRLMGGVMLLRWPVSLYQGALMGLRRHLAMNVATSVAATLQGGGAVLVLWLVSSSITAFFTWQIAAAAIQIALLVGLTWRSLRLADHRPLFARSAVTAVLGFSAGVTGITLLSVVLTQLDKVILSKLLPLDQFGYYSLAGTIAAILGVAGGAIYGAVFPAMTRFVTLEDQNGLAQLYHKSAQLLSLVVIPAGVGLAFFAHTLLALYLHDEGIARQVAPLLSLLAIGNLFLALMLMPLGLQLAFGWTRLSLYKNLVAVALFVPMMLYMVHRHGAMGAATVWIMLTAGYFLIEVQVMHRRLLRGEQWRWYLVDVGVPAVWSLAWIGGAKLLVPADASLAWRAGAAALAMVAAFGTVALTLPFSRALLRALVSHRRGGHVATAEAA